MRAENAQRGETGARRNKREEFWLFRAPSRLSRKGLLAVYLPPCRTALKFPSIRTQCCPVPVVTSSIPALLLIKSNITVTADVISYPNGLSSEKTPGKNYHVLQFDWPMKMVRAHDFSDICFARAYRQISLDTSVLV